VWPKAASLSSETILLPDAGPLITLAYANALDLLEKPGWQVAIVDMVLHEVTRNATPTSTLIAQWVDAHSVPILPTRTFAAFRAASEASTEARGANAGAEPPCKANLGELAIQESMNELAIAYPSRTAVFLFEDHKIARTGFVLPDNCRKISTRAYLTYLEQKGWLDSAARIERQAVQGGRSFSALRFPP
jgi:hypothetical protein